MLKILIAFKDFAEAISKELRDHEVDTPPEGAPLLEFLTKNRYDLVLLKGGTELLPSIKHADPRVEVILFCDKEDAVEAVKQGASACFKLPINLELLKDTVQSIYGEFKKRQDTEELERRLIEKYTFADVVGKNPLMLDIFALIRRIAPYFKTVTIMGETGTGKEVIARALHAISPNAQSPFIACNCASLVETLAESELFGHKKGAFTGALADKVGLFEAAQDGTIFLDEIGDLPHALQPHLLRVLENGEFRPVGGNKSFKANCRVIAATNRDLTEEVRSNRFRADLFYRLTPLTIHVPPLRDRKDDIPLLSKFFLGRFGQRTGKKIYGISRPAQCVMMSYEWPGNVRELENIVEQAAIMTTESFIRFTDLPEHIRDTGQRPAPATSSLNDTIRRHIQEVLNQCMGNRTHAAKILGISRRALLRKIEKYFIQ